MARPSGFEPLTESQNPDTTVGDVLGTSSIKTVIRESLAASLPYELITRKLVALSQNCCLKWATGAHPGGWKVPKMNRLLVNTGPSHLICKALAKLKQLR